MKQYHYNGKQLWQYTIEDNYKCSCGCNVFHKEYNQARNKIWYICNACNDIVGELKTEYTQEDLKIGLWK